MYYKYYRTGRESHICEIFEVFICKKKLKLWKTKVYLIVLNINNKHSPNYGANIKIIEYIKLQIVSALYFC